MKEKSLVTSKSTATRRSKVSATSSRSLTTLETSAFDYEKPSVPWKPHHGQKLGIKYLLEHAAAGLFAEPGVGKTSIVFGAFKVLRKKKVASRMLVIAPLRPCYLVWPAEVKKWLDFNDFKVVIIHGTEKEARLREEADIFVINPEGLPWLFESGGAGRVGNKLKRLRELNCDTLVVDELSKFKHTSSTRFKLMKQVIHLFQRRWGLTGSPASNGLEGLFGQIYMLDQGRSFGQYITHFRREFFLPSYTGYGWDLKKGGEEAIYERLAPVVLRLEAKDYIDMPKFVPIPPAWFELPPSARQLYDLLEEQQFAKLEDKVITAVNAGVVSMKCRQVASGAVYMDDDVRQLVEGKPRDVHIIHDIKLDMLEDLLEELQGSPLLLAYEFRHDLSRILERLGDVPYIGAGVTEKQSRAIERDWNRGKLPLLLGNPQSIGHGLNLQECGNHVGWFTMTWDYELYDQFNRRVYRQGNAFSHVFVHHFAAKDTVEEIVWWALQSKGKTQTALFDALKKQFTAKKRRGKLSA